MKILVLNSGSSSVKYKLFEYDNGNYNLCASGMAERIGLKESKIKQVTFDGKVIERVLPLQNHKQALESIEDALTDAKNGILKEFTEIKAVGHRVVHGGEKFSGAVRINSDVIDAIKECCDLAPLHNPPNLLGIEACFELLKDIPQVAVFDTAFHQTMPKKAYLYGLDYEQYHKYGIRKYGFHGTSHGYVASAASGLLNKDISELRLITVHLGNGCSITAVEKGRSIDTSMGLTPLEGVMMGTRCGDIDPYIPLHLMDKEKLTLDEVNTLLNKKSGLLGLCGKSDMRDVLVDYKSGDERAKVAVDVYTYRVAKYIGSYVAVMNGVDAIVFTAGIGENSPEIRKFILSYFSYLGVEIDEKANADNSPIITTSDSKVKALVVRTNEELVIAKETVALI